MFIVPPPWGLFYHIKHEKCASVSINVLSSQNSKGNINSKFGALETVNTVHTYISTFILLGSIILASQAENWYYHLSVGKSVDVCGIGGVLPT